MIMPFNRPRMRLLRALYSVLWILILPFVFVYLWRRGTRDPLYRKGWGERLGFYSQRFQGSAWVHAVSMGEMRSAGPLVQKLLDQKEKVVLTHFTPAGKAEAHKLFGSEIGDGRVASVYVPFEIGLCFALFFRAFKPKYGLVMEVEWWPKMIASCRRSNIPLIICNGQYPSKRFDEDRLKQNWRFCLPSGFAGVLAKSDTQAERFRAAGAQDIHITGEMRFDQPINQKFVRAAKVFEGVQNRSIITLASVVSGEDETYIAALKRIKNNLPNTLFVYVPRAPERFDETLSILDAAGFNTVKRSVSLDDNLKDLGTTNWSKVDVLLGDSLGEMYFYLSLCDAAITGGGFTPHGAHNVIEPLALKKPVFVGPQIWTIEYPAIEAIDAGVLTHVQNADDLANGIVEFLSGTEDTSKAIDAFYAQHAGSVEKTMKVLSKIL